MNRKPTSTPDLLTPVVAALKKLEAPKLSEAARACQTSITTLKNLRDGHTGPKGPSYQMVAALHRHLVAEQSA